MTDRPFAETRWTRDAQGRWVPPPLQAAFIEWLTTPQIERDPPTQELWSRANGVSKDAPRRWKREPRFRQAWQDACSDINISPERLQDIIQTLHTQAVAGDTQAAKLYLSYVAQLAPPQKITIDDKRSVHDLSDDEIRAQLAEMAEDYGLRVSG
jgi:hypothetical protein